MPNCQAASNPTTSDRREFLRRSGAAAVALTCAASASAKTPAAKPAPIAAPEKRRPLKLGVASYTFRHFDLDKTLAMTRRAGLKYICLKSFHLPLEAKPQQIAEAVKKAADAGLVLYAGGVITMANADQVSQAFDYAKAAGMRMIVGAPSAEMLPLIDRKIKEYGLAVAIHNHGPGDKHFPTPQSAYEKIKDLDRRLGLCIDVGHTVRIGADLIASIERYADRLLDVHLKDISEAAPRGHCVPMGRGVMDLPALVRALVKVKFDGVAAYEYEIDEKDPLPGLSESIGYTHGLLDAI